MLPTIMTFFLLAGGVKVAIQQSADCPCAKRQGQSYPMRFLRTVSFDYLIYADQVAWPDQPELCRRNLYVLMDEAAFREANLRELFAVLADAFPEPQTLSVSVSTSLEQIRPTGPSGVSGEPDLPNASKHHSAGYLRMGANEFFRYIAHPPESKWTTVVLKGIDPSADIRDR